MAGPHLSLACLICIYVEKKMGWTPGPGALACAPAPDGHRVLAGEIRRQSLPTVPHLRNLATVRRREARRGKNSATRRHARGKGETLLRWRPCRCAPRMRKRAARAKKRYTRQNRAGACTGQCRAGVGTNTKTVRTRNSTSGPGRPRPVGRFACLLTRCFVSPRATVPHRTIPPCAPCVIS